MELLEGEEECIDVAEGLAPRAQSFLQKAGTNKICGRAEILMACYIYVLKLALMCWRLGSDFWELEEPVAPHLFIIVVAVLMRLTDFVTLAFHWHFARIKRYCKRHDMVRMAEVAPTDIRVKEMRCCLRLGMAIFPISALFLLLATWPVLHEGDEVNMGIKVGITIFHILFLYGLSFFPHMATTLLLQEDLEHLGAFLTRAIEAGTLEAMMDLLDKVASIKRRWGKFLCWHFLLEGGGAAAYVLAMISSYVHRGTSEHFEHFSLSWMMRIMSLGPLFAIYLLWQVMSLARFNSQILRFKKKTDSNTMYRLISQHEDELEFRVLGKTITHNKIRAVMFSVIFSTCGKIIIALATH